ncbi:MAG: hypothetical protein L6V93_05450 [Clostridiales bacterium]|nr:MAG: hypothetical protein L6V93_05450 [Clostridiales bacterium]
MRITILKFFLTNDGYLKKNFRRFTAFKLGAKSLKTAIFIVLEQETTNKADLVLISNMCNAYKLKLHEVADCKASDWGHFAPNIAKMEQGEKLFSPLQQSIMTAICFTFLKTERLQGLTLKSYETKTNRKKLYQRIQQQIKARYG